MFARALLPTITMTAILAAPTYAASDIKVGVITPTTGPLKPYGDSYLDALNWGLKYYTGGKMAIDGRKFAITIKDDAGDPDLATSYFKDMASNGTRMIVGSSNLNSAIALAAQAEQSKVLFISGSVKNDTITNASSKYVFRSGNTATQDLATFAGIKPLSGRRIVIFVEDNNFGAGIIAATKALLGAKSVNFVEIKVPPNTSDFNTYAKQAADAKGSYIILGWSNGLTAGAMLQALKSQGAFIKQRPLTTLSLTSTYNSFGALFEGSNAIFVTSCFPDAGKSKAAKSLVSYLSSAKKSPDLATCAGADAAKMIVRALTNNPEQNVDQMVSLLEGYSWVGVKGLMKINPSNHILIQPMFLASLKKSSNGYIPQIEKTISNVTG